MTHFLQHPHGIFLRSDDELLSVGKQLQIGTYIVNQTPAGEYFLAKVESFTRPAKTYGLINKKADRIMTTFADRASSTGILLSGEQGSGKTMLARELSLRGADVGLATIIVNAPYCGPSFNQFIQLINVPAVIIFDEFEKLYDDDDQEKMLTLLDGLFPTKKLFVLTCNNVHRIDEHLLNRPGRIFYHLKYEGLEKEFILEYCEDLLKDKEEIGGVVHISGHFWQFNFDMLKAIVEEMNRYNIGAAEAVEMLNMSPSVDRNFEHKAELKVDGKILELSDSDLHCNPLDGETISVTVYKNDNDYDEVTDKPIIPPALVSKAIYRQTPGSAHFGFNVDDLVSVDNNIFVFAKDNAILTLVRKVEKKFKYMAY